MHAIKHRSLYKGGPSHTLFIASSSSMTYNVLHVCDVEQRKNWEATGSTIKSETSRCTAGMNSCMPAEPKGISYHTALTHSETLDQGLPWVEVCNEKML